MRQNNPVWMRSQIIGGEDVAHEEDLDELKREFMAHTASIVAAHASANKLSEADLLGLIGKVYGELHRIGARAPSPADGAPARAESAPPRPAAPPSAPAIPAVPIQKSVHADYIICLEDGRPVKMLKPYLARHFGLTPDLYRAKWDLPPEYPMVAPQYAKHRSALAKTMGLGGKKAPTRRPRRAGKS